MTVVHRCSQVKLCQEVECYSQDPFIRDRKGIYLQDE